MLDATIALGQRLREFRDRAGLTQEQLAAASGVTFSTVLRIERGKGSPTVTTLRKIAKGLGVPPAELLR